MTRLLTGALAILTVSVCAQEQGPLRIEKQGSFFVGGRDVHSDTLSSTMTRLPVGTITVDQVYVRYQIPDGPSGHPITFIHGCCLTGKTWETTPDGRTGWDEYFVRHGHGVYVIDQASRGRSAANPSAINRVKLGRGAADQLPPVSSVSHEEAWNIFRFGPEYPKVFTGMQFPLEAQDELWKQMVPDWIEALPMPNPTVPALSELAQRLNGTVLVSHSQSGIYPFQTAALSTKGIAGIVAIEPAACPTPADDMRPFVKMPILVLFGDYVSESSRWAPRLKACRDFAQAASKAGAYAEVVLLPDLGFHGNSHMLMQDRNSLQVADWLLGWIDRRIERRELSGDAAGSGLPRPLR
jgi:pimeloyl-ACP methyl ester carboxylesterase